MPPRIFGIEPPSKIARRLYSYIGIVDNNVIITLSPLQKDEYTFCNRER